MSTVPIRVGAAGWWMSRQVILRTTGFPIDLVQRLRWPATAAAAADLAGAEQELIGLAGPTERAVTIRAQLARAAVRLGPAERTDPSWVAAVTRYRAAHRALDRTADTEAGAIPSVADLATDPRLREALAVSNPKILRDLDRRGTAAQVTHQLATFLQRVCLKNETLSFFGPINYATVDPEAPDGIALSWPGPAALRARRAHAASWVVAAVGDAVAFAEPVREWLVLRRRSDGVARWKGDPAGLPARLLDLADGQHTLGALARRLGVPLPAAVGAAAALCAAGVAWHQFEVPPSHPDPLALLVNRVAGVPGGAACAARLAELIAVRDGFCADGAEGKAARQDSFLAAARRIAPRLGDGSGRAGQFYTDRLPLREECAGLVDLRIGGRAATELGERVAPALDFLAAAALRRRALARRSVARRLGVRRLSLWKLVSVAHSWPQPTDDELGAAVAEAVPDPDAPEVDLAAGPRLAALVAAAGAAGIGAVCSVDLLVAAADDAAWAAGDYDVVLGDVHDTALLTDWALQFHPAAHAARAERDATAAGAYGPVPAVTVLARRQTGIPPLELPGPTVELGGPSGQPNPWLVELRDLIVHSDGTEARLRCEPIGGEVALHNGELDTLVQTAFAPPRLRAPGIVLGAHTPRLRWGRAVVQRESWVLPLAELLPLGAASPAGALLAAARVRATYRLPEQVFVHLPGVRKPVFADLASPALLRAVARAARRTASDEPDQQARITELLPGLGRLWLRGPHGRHTAELRCVFARRHRPPGGSADGAAPGVATAGRTAGMGAAATTGVAG